MAGLDDCEIAEDTGLTYSEVEELCDAEYSGIQSRVQIISD